MHFFFFTKNMYYVRNDNHNDDDELVQPLWKPVWRFLKKLKMELIDPVIPLLGLYPKKPETPVRKHICTPMFMAALFTTAKVLQQPKCSSVDEWIKKDVYVLYIVEHYVPVKKEELLTLCNSMDGSGDYYYAR